MTVYSGDRNPNWRGGKSKHPLYNSYHEMVARCTRPTHPRYADYGGRGITVCERWRSDFWAFVSDMGERPPGYSLDRIDNDAGYSPGNCRWATPAEQRANRRPERPRGRCPNGHVYTPETTGTGRWDRRRCLICAEATRERKRLLYQAKSAREVAA